MNARRFSGRYKRQRARYFSVFYRVCLEVDWIETDLQRLERLARLRRADALTTICNAKAGHLGGTMSGLDILCALHYAVMRQDELFLLSKGHSVEGYLAILADLGYFPKDELRSYSANNSRLIGHPNNKVPGVAMNTGSLGHGLSVAVGWQIAETRDGGNRRAFVLMGDGEQGEGSVWEAAMAAAHYKLDRLFAIVDRNGLQINGATEEVMALGDLAAKWRAFGWDVHTCDGNNMTALMDYFGEVRPQGKPHALIAKTVKGQGMPFAQGNAEWHHKVPDEREMLEGYCALGWGSRNHMQNKSTIDRYSLNNLDHLT